MEAQGDHTPWWHGHTRGAPGHGVGHPWPSTYSPSCHFFLSRENTSSLLKPVFLLFSLAIFDLLAQAIFSAEICSI